MKYAALLLVCALSAFGFTGADTLWRPREHMVFYFDNADGKSFDIAVTVRDMNLYLQGARPLYAFVVAPDGRIVAENELADDGITSGDRQHADGYADIWMDCRHREYLRQNRLPQKPRSPLLAAPEQLPPRALTLAVPGGAPGLYRLVLASSFDHWLSVTPSRPLPTAVYPGQGTLSLPAGKELTGFLRLPESTRDVALAVIEETEPFQARARLELDGKTAAEIMPRTFFNTAVWRNAPRQRTAKLTARSAAPGASLLVRGVPFILAPTPELAEKIGAFTDPDCAIVRGYAATLPGASAERKALLKAAGFGANFSFADSELPLTVKGNGSTGDFLRSAWWPLNDGLALLALEKNFATMPEPVRAALIRLADRWAAYRMTMEQGMCTNQWTYDLEHMAKIGRMTGSSRVNTVLKRNVARLCTPNSLGRYNPADLRFAAKHAPDSGLIDSGIMAENMGHDNEYNLESDANMAQVWQISRSPEILRYLDDYYKLKTHLTLPKNGVDAPSPFTGSCSPTDANSRTRCYTHKSAGDAVLPRIAYGDLWQGKPERSVWPCLESKPFTRNFADRFYFVNTGKYYAILFGGAPSVPAITWNMARERSGSFELNGFGGCGYGLRQRGAVKSGGLSAIFIPGAGPMLLANNHNVMYANTLWGRTTQEQFKLHAPEVDPRITCDGFADAEVTFDAAKRVYTRSGTLPGTVLDFVRTITLNDDMITIRVELTARKAFEMAELYEAIPFFADARTLTADNKPIALPAATVAGSAIDPKLDGETDAVPPFEAKTLTLRAANGKGIEIEFAAPHRFRLATVLRYRPEASAMSALSFALPTRWNTGEKHTVEYQINL